MTMIHDSAWAEWSDECVDHVVGMIPDELPPVVEVLPEIVKKRLKAMPPTLHDISESGDDPEDDRERHGGRHGDSYPLGSYKPMKSPGEITLYLDNLGGYFWHLLDALLDEDRGRLTHLQIRRLATATVYVTYLHERFHHYCDVVRTKPQSSCKPPDAEARKAEEALAVAFSWYGLHHERIAFCDIPGPIWKGFIDLRFKYSCLGYKCWPRYAHSHTFADKVDGHLEVGDLHKALGANSGKCPDDYDVVKGLLSCSDWNTKRVTFAFVPQPCSNTSMRSSPSVPRVADAPSDADVAVIRTRSEALHAPSNHLRVCRALSREEYRDLQGGSFDGDVHLCHTQLESLDGINERLKRVQGTLCLYGNPIRSNVLHVFRIDGLQRVVRFDSGDAENQERLVKVSSIVNKHLKDGEDGLIECQHELIEAGSEFVAYANVG